MKTKEEIIELLKTDVQAFNAYRQELFDEGIYDLDLSRVDLSSASLNRANLYNADLSNANLSSTSLNRANLYNVDLWNADLFNANLENANLRNADLRNANLRNADLRNANLRNVDLRNVDLSCAKLDQEFIQVIGLGSEKRMTTYLFSDDIIFCGCFKGSLKEFKKRVKETYPDENNKYRLEYLDFIKMINKKRKRLKNDFFYKKGNN